MLQFPYLKYKNSMVKLRLQRFGSRNQPFYRLVAIDNKERRNGKPVENLGTYNPLTNPPTVVVNRKRFDYWISVGAIASDPVRMIVLGEKLKKAKLPKKEQSPEKTATKVTAEQSELPKEKTAPKAPTVEPSPKISMGSTPETTNEPKV